VATKELVQEYHFGHEEARKDTKTSYGISQKGIIQLIPVFLGMLEQPNRSSAWLTALLHAGYSR
jgi:hypothetical protein